MFLGLYLSLLWQRSAAAWPDWGKLAAPLEIVDLALRRDYGTFQLKANNDARVDIGLVVVGRELVRSWHLLLALVGVGAMVAITTSRGIAFALLGSLGAASIFLWSARYGGHPIATTAYLERFSGPFVLPAAVLVGLGFQALSSVAARARIAKVALPVLVVIYVAHAWVSGREGADFSENRALELLSAGIALTLPKDAIWLAESDIEVLGGITNPDGTHRFPIAAGLLWRPWYRDRVLLALEPRMRAQELHEGGPYASGVEAIVAWAHRQQVPVASTERALLASARGRSQVLGPLFIASPEPERELDPVAAAASLCPLVEELRPLPAGRQLFSHEAFIHFARAFDAASTFLMGSGSTEAATQAARVARALETRTDAEGWRSGCQQLSTALNARRGALGAEVPENESLP